VITAVILPKAERLSTPPGGMKMTQNCNNYCTEAKSDWKIDVALHGEVKIYAAPPPRERFL
jgi:hypothetical protein